MTPSGKPASFKIRINNCAEYTWVLAHFHTTTLPHIAALAGKLPPIAVKLNGVRANTNPSKGRYSKRLYIPAPLIGCCL